MFKDYKGELLKLLERIILLKIWICWNFREVNGKRTKVPCDCNGESTGTDSKYQDTWASYEEASEAQIKNGFSGIGFIVPTGFFFLDIDHRNIDDPMVQDLLNRFDTYAEKSVSGDGFHLYGMCDLNQMPTYIDKGGSRRLSKDFYQKNPNTGVELYIGGLTNRFAVFTGDMINQKPIRECTEAVLETLEKDMRKVRSEKQSKQAREETQMKLRVPSTQHSEKDNKMTAEIVNALRNQSNGKKFSKLFDQGDHSEYKSASEADIALCAMIAFRTGPDPEMVDRVFRASALYRGKWERDDYRTQTISAGIEACNGTFYKEKVTPSFIRFNSKTGEPYVVTTKLARYIRENVHFILVRDSGKQGTMIYVYKDGAYRFYSKDMMLGVIKQPVMDYDEELVRMSTINEVYQHLITDLDYVPQSKLDSNETVINFQNGLLQVTDNELNLIPHDPNIYSTIQIPCNWPEKPTPTPVYDEYLRTLTNNDPEVAELLEQFIGVCLSNLKGWRTKKALFLVGDGNTGKSQLKNLVERLLGKGNFIGIDLDDIEARFGTGAIYGTRLAGSSDMSFMSVKELKTFKKITGGDSLFAEFKGQQGFEYTYNGLLWFCMNRLPRFSGDDGKWVYDRIMIVQCPNVIPPEKQDKRLLDKLYAERDGIVFRAINAFQRVIANGYRFSEPESVVRARTEYIEENNTVINFFTECMCGRSSSASFDRFTTTEVYDVYKAWCKDNNNGICKTAKEFRNTLCKHLNSQLAEITVHTNKGTCYENFTLTEDCRRQYAPRYY